MSGLPPLPDLLPMLAIVVGTLALLLACAAAMRQARIAQDALHGLSVDHARVCTELAALRADCRTLMGELELWQAGLYGEGAVPPEVRIGAPSQEEMLPLFPEIGRSLRPTDLSQ